MEKKSSKFKTFLGTGWSFPPVFNRNELQVEMVSDEEDIKQSLMLLLSTYPGERITNLRYGCRIHQLTFDSVTQNMLDEIRQAIELAVLYFEPRITLLKINIDTKSAIEGVIYIELVYLIRRVNIRSNIVYPFYKLEGTNITALM